MRKIFILIFAVCICAVFCACGAQKTAEVSEPVFTTAVPTTASPTVATVPTTEPPVTVVKEILEGETITMEDGSTFTINSTDWTYKLVAALSENSTLCIAEADAGNIVYYVKMTYVNNSKTEFSWDKYGSWKMVLTYGDGYEYTGYATVTNDLAPLMTGDFYCYVKVPEQIKSDGKSISVRFVFGEEEYSFAEREEGEAAIVDPNLAVNEKRISENKGEITLVKTFSTKKLVPPQASGWYTYYEAAEGYSYVACQFVVKNLGMENMLTDNAIKGYATVDDLKVDGFCVMTDRNQSDFGNYDFEILAEHTAYFLLEIPDDKLNAKISFNIRFADENYVLDYLGA